MHFMQDSFVLDEVNNEWAIWEGMLYVENKGNGLCSRENTNVLSPAAVLWMPVPFDYIQSLLPLCTSGSNKSDLFLWICFFVFNYYEPTALC